MSAVQPEGGPTVRRRILGAELRRLRELAEVSRQAAGHAIRASESKISRMEHGQVGFKRRDVCDLLELYGVRDPQRREALLTTARESNKRGWWHPYADALPTWFPAYVDLEEAARVIRTYEVQFVPGLLQTAEYARAVMRQSADELTDEEIDRRIELRIRRQSLLARSNGPRLWAVVDEGALRRPIGGPRVLRAQIEHLLRISKLSNVILQVMPFRVGGHAGEAGSFTILRYPEPELPDIVYIEQLTHAIYLEKREEVDKYLLTMERLCVQGASPHDSTDMLSKILAGD